MQASSTQRQWLFSPSPSFTLDFNWCCLWMGWESRTRLALSHTSHAPGAVHFPLISLSISDLPFLGRVPARSLDS